MLRQFMTATLTAGAVLIASAGVEAADVCTGYGPQTPRDIAERAGANPRVFALAPPAAEMNLCNIHFHAQAEHKGPGFSVASAAAPAHGAPAAHGAEAKDAHGAAGGGYRCNDTAALTPAELAPTMAKGCAGVAPGDTVEVHWVHTSCDAKPGSGLGACLTEACANPQLRVETQVFLAVNDASALQFEAFAHGGHMAGGVYQARALPEGTGAPVTFRGSTTGPSFTEQACSPLQVTWSVRPQCAKLDIASLHRWCAQNPFGENHAHGVRTLVTNPALLAVIE